MKTIDLGLIAILVFFSGCTSIRAGRSKVQRVTAPDGTVTETAESSSPSVSSIPKSDVKDFKLSTPPVSLSTPTKPATAGGDSGMSFDSLTSLTKNSLFWKIAAVVCFAGAVVVWILTKNLLWAGLTAAVGGIFVVVDIYPWAFLLLFVIGLVYVAYAVYVARKAAGQSTALDYIVGQIQAMKKTNPDAAAILTDSIGAAAGSDESAVRAVVDEHK